MQAPPERDGERRRVLVPEQADGRSDGSALSREVRADIDLPAENVGAVGPDADLGHHVVGREPHDDVVAVLEHHGSCVTEAHRLAGADRRSNGGTSGSTEVHAAILVQVPPTIRRVRSGSRPRLHRCSLDRRSTSETFLDFFGGNADLGQIPNFLVTPTA